MAGDYTINLDITKYANFKDVGANCKTSAKVFGS
jgi:hypothetical protein